MNKNFLILLFLVSGNFIQANLQEKLATKIKEINSAKQNIKAGKPVVVNEDCSRCKKSCKRCRNCGVCIRG